MSMRFALAVMACFGATGVGAQSPAPTTDKPPTLEFAFEEVVTLAADIPVGATALGRRNIVPITGGTFEGPGIKGTILPGGWDWQLARADGCLQVKADYMLKTDDGAIINVLNQGVACRPDAQGVPSPTRTVAIFEAPLGRYAWLGKSAFVGTLVPGRREDGPSVRIRFYRAR